MFEPALAMRQKQEADLEVCTAGRLTFSFAAAAYETKQTSQNLQQCSVTTYSAHTSSAEAITLHKAHQYAAQSRLEINFFTAYYQA